MQLKKLNPRQWRLTQQQRRLGQATLAGLAVAAVISVTLWAGLFTSTQVRAADYLYDTTGDPGDDIVIVAIDEKSQSRQALGEWPWRVHRYAQLFERLKGASAVGFDVLLTDPGPAGNPDTPALLEATRQVGNVIMPLTALQLIPPRSPGELYSAGQTVRPFPALLEAAATAGAVGVALDSDGTLRRVPLLVDAGGGETWQGFSLRILRRHLAIGDDPASLVGDRVVIGDETEIRYQVPTDANGTMLVNFVGQPNTFPSYSFVDVIQDRVPPSAFEDKIVLVGMMNTVGEMDLHRTPVSAGRMAGVEFQANAIHTLLNHRPLVPQSREGTIVTVLLLTLVSAVVLSQLEAVPGALFTVLLAAGYFAFASLQFDAGHLPNVLFPYTAVFINYAMVTATRFASARGDRRRVMDTFGRFVSAEVRDEIMDMALQDPDLIRPGGRQMEISILFADIRGFTTMSEELPPSEVVDILNQYLDSMEEQVFEHGGTLDKYTGDGMMVLFGAPLEQPDHAQRAVKVALAMQRAAADVSRRRGDVRWKVIYGIGITTGPAVVGHIGSKRRLDYTAVGDTVNLAARLEGIAPPGAILINRATFEAVKDIAVIEELEPKKIKGKAEPVAVYRVLGLRDDEPADATA
jgi:adenylate cyclase